MKKLTGVYIEVELLEKIQIWCIKNKTDLTKLTNKLLAGVTENDTTK